jgi:transcriptional regulator with XRE-family HTH domain
LTVNKAVVALRKYLKQTQQRFATSLDMSISALQNYEQARMPEAKQLLRFHHAAHDAGRDDLARIFLVAAQEALGCDIEVKL